MSEEFRDGDEYEPTQGFSNNESAVHEPVVMFLQKDGVYGHGIFWIGTNEAEGREAADNAANLDEDDYHSWNLYRFKNQQHFDRNASHEIIYTARKNMALINQRSRFRQKLPGK